MHVSENSKIRGIRLKGLSVSEEFSRCLPEVYCSGEPSDVVDVARFAILTAAWSPDVEEIVEAAEKIESLPAE